MTRASRRKYHIIYKTTCLITGKWYIGMHSTDNLNDGYQGSGTHLWRSIKKYGREQHKTEILEHLTDRASLGEREKELVTKQLLLDVLCMNLIIGGTGLTDRPSTKEETKRKIGIKSAATLRTPEWCAKISKSNTGKPKVRTPEGDASWRSKMEGYVWKQEHIDARTEGQKNSEKFKKRYRPVIIDGITYSNGCEAVERLGIPGSTIHNRVTSKNWLNYRWADQPEKDPSFVSKRARGAYK
jgi:hypothetical protein